MDNKIYFIGIVLFSILFSSCTNMSISATDIPTIHNGTTLVTENYIYSVASGEVNNGVVWNKFGYNPDVDNNQVELIAYYGGNTSQFLNSGEILNISSNNSNDANGGIGAESVIIYGVFDNWTSGTEIVSLNGTNIVQTTKSFRGINRMSTYLAGSDFRNDGEITAISANSNKIQAVIPQAQGTTEQAFLFISANKTFLSNWLSLNMNKLVGGAAPKITITGWVRSYVSNSEYNIYQATIDTSVENTIQLTPETPFIIGEKSILYFTATSDTNNAVVNMRFSGILKQND